MEVIFGTETESTRLENGILYRFDVTKVMFASGNVDERERMKSMDCTGETVVDGTAHSRYRVPPQQRIAEALSDLPEDVRSRLPMKWEHVGSILIIRLDRSADPYLGRIGEVYASEV